MNMLSTRTGIPLAKRELHHSNSQINDLIYRIEDSMQESASNLIDIVVNRLFSYYENSWLYVNISTGDVKGILISKLMVIQLERKEEEEEICICDTENKEMIVVKYNEFGDMDLLKPDNPFSIVDLTFSGIRWEGPVFNGHPFGYGVIYSEKNDISYEGFVYNNEYVGFGTEFYNDVESIRYCGYYMNSLKWGEGIMYDRYQQIDYDGCWYNNLPYDYSDNDLSHYPWVKHTLADFRTTSPLPKLNDMVDVILTSELASLKYVELSSDEIPLQLGKLFVNSLRDLKQLKIGNTSFISYLNWMKGHSMDNENSDYYLIQERECYVMNCSALEEMSFGHMTFIRCSYVRFEYLVNLERIRFGRNSFQYVTYMEFQGK